MKDSTQTRREMIRKTALFAVPTIVSFQLSELQVQASGLNQNLGNQNRNRHRNRNQNGNNGNHYGNDKPDQNPRDWKNKHDGF